jgi:hypothetical protein
VVELCKIDPRKCRKDAETFCGAEDDWHHKSDDDGGSAKFVFPCLVRSGQKLVEKF